MPDDIKRKLQQPSGKVRHDPGGRAVWQWAVESGRHAIESTSRLLKKLDLSGLDVVDYDEIKHRGKESQDKEQGKAPDQPIPTFGGKPEADPLAGSKRGFNPYDSRTPTRPTAGRAAPKSPPKPRITQPARPAKKPGFLARLFGK